MPAADLVLPRTSACSKGEEAHGPWARHCPFCDTGLYESKPHFLRARNNAPGAMAFGLLGELMA